AAAGELAAYHARLYRGDENPASAGTCFRRSGPERRPVSDVGERDGGAAVLAGPRSYRLSSSPLHNEGLGGSHGRCQRRQALGSGRKLAARSISFVVSGPLLDDELGSSDGNGAGILERRRSRAASLYRPERSGRHYRHNGKPHLN